MLKQKFNGLQIRGKKRMWIFACKTEEEFDIELSIRNIGLIFVASVDEGRDAEPTRNNGYMYVCATLALTFRRLFIVSAGQSSSCSALGMVLPTDAHLNVPVETKTLLCVSICAVVRLMGCLAGRSGVIWLSVT
jgi:hypothetical protein